ncbi:MAG: Spy/CpxP family protein refolding chaperone [Hyphomonadaceae bacterium]|nr:Spy/CpxP family protein refolding chaperone [Hyphomonadaceae bacterium]
MLHTATPVTRSTAPDAAADARRTNRVRRRKAMMNRLKNLCSAAAFAGLVMSSATGASAQGRMPGEMRGRMPGMEMMDGGMMRMMAECGVLGGDMATHAEGRIAFLKAELGVSDAQKAVWEAYAAALAKNLQGMQGMRQAMMKAMEAKSPVERLDSHIAAMEGRVAALKEVKPALGTLYSALSEDQKKKADQLLTGVGCMM